jgi:hypothetical protein
MIYYCKHFSQVLVDRTLCWPTSSGFRWREDLGYFDKPLPISHHHDYDDGCLKFCKILKWSATVENNCLESTVRYDSIFTWTHNPELHISLHVLRQELVIFLVLDGVWGDRLLFVLLVELLTITVLSFHVIMIYYCKHFSQVRRNKPISRQVDLFYSLNLRWMYNKYHNVNK